MLFSFIYYRIIFIDLSIQIQDKYGDRMDFKYLQIFVAIADAGTLTAAAENLHIAQSALSRHLRNIEEEYGAQLMLRGL